MIDAMLTPAQMAELTGKSARWWRDQARAGMTRAHLVAFPAAP